MRVPKNEFKRSPQLKPWQVSLNRFFNRAWFELLIGALVLLSVSLTLFEFWLDSELVFGKAKVLTPLGVLTIFAEFWLDILAVIPLFRIFRSARALRLLRVVRLFRLLGVFQRLSSHYPRIFRNNFVDFIVVSGMLLIAVVFGTIAITYFESHANLNHLSQNNLAGGSVGRF